MQPAPQRTRIKICGLTRPQDVHACAVAGADAVGFVFYPPSPRAVSLEQAAALARLLPPFMTPVGLFVNAATREIERACQAIPGLLLQFHGDESPADCERHGRPFIRAARVEAGFDLLDFARRHHRAQALLLDAHVQGYGGAGKVFDWSLIPPTLAQDALCRVVLSGGLHAGNVTEGILRLRPWAVDVSSGVETLDAAGRRLKDEVAIRRFCEAVREADARIAAGMES